MYRPHIAESRLPHLEFLFQIRSNFYHHGQFTSTIGGSSGAPNVTVQLEHARIFIKIRFNFYHNKKFRSASGGSSGAQNTAVHLKHARIFI
jgi:hypothetical protein